MCVLQLTISTRTRTSKCRRKRVFHKPTPSGWSANRKLLRTRCKLVFLLLPFSFSTRVLLNQRVRLAFQIRVRQLEPVQRHVRRGHQDEESVLQGSSGLHADHDQADGRRVRRPQATGGRKMFLGAVLVEQNVSKTKYRRDGQFSTRICLPSPPPNHR